MIATENDLVPLGYDLGSLVGGAVDYIDKNCGFFGWYHDMTRPGEISEVTASAHGEKIARSICFRARPDIDSVVGSATSAGFMFGWSRFDQRLLTELFSRLGDAPIKIREALTGPQLQWLIPQLPRNTVIWYYLVSSNCCIPEFACSKILGTQRRLSNV